MSLCAWKDHETSDSLCPLFLRCPLSFLPPTALQLPYPKEINPAGALVPVSQRYALPAGQMLMAVAHRETMLLRRNPLLLLALGIQVLEVAIQKAGRGAGWQGGCSGVVMERASMYVCMYELQAQLLWYLCHG